MGQEYHSARLREERNRLGISQAALGEHCGVTKQTVFTWEKGTSIPSDKLEICARLGMDVQYILTGIRSTNLDQVAEESGTYIKTTQGVGALSRDEEALIDHYRHLPPGDRTRAQAIVDALAQSFGAKKKGADGT